MIEILYSIYKCIIFLINNFLLNFTVSFTCCSHKFAHKMFNILMSSGVNGVLSFQEDWTISKTWKDESSSEIKLFMINLQNFPSSNCREYNLLGTRKKGLITLQIKLIPDRSMILFVSIKSKVLERLLLTFAFEIILMKYILIL